MSDRVDEPPIDQAQAGRRKPSVDTKAVGAVAVKQQRILTVFLRSFAVDNRQRDLGAIRRQRVKTLRHVIVGIEATQNLFLLQERLLARHHIMVIDRQRRLHRGVFKSHRGGVELEIGSEVSAIRRFGEFQIIAATARPRDHTEQRQATGSFFEHQVIAKNLKVAEEDIRSMGNNFFPVLPAGRSNRSGHQAEILRLIVRANQEAILVMIDVIFVVSFPRQKDFELAEWIARVQVAVFLAQSVGRNDHQILLGLGLEYIRRVSFVGFLEDKLIVLDVSAEKMAIDPVGSQGGRILFGIKERLVVIRPSEILGDLGDHVRKQLARC